MSIEIDILNADASWKQAEPLFDAVWPPQVVAQLPWANIVFAHAELRVLVRDEAGDLVCHVGVFRRDVTWNGRKMRAGGIGGVLTREDKRNRGYASIALDAAIRTTMARHPAAVIVRQGEPRPPPVHGDATYVEQACRNLLDIMK